MNLGIKKTVLDWKPYGNGTRKNKINQWKPSCECAIYSKNLKELSVNDMTASETRMIGILLPMVEISKDVSGRYILILFTSVYLRFNSMLKCDKTKKRLE